MGEAPDIREQEDCSSADVCEGMCDQHGGTKIDHLVELRGVYDGWSIAVHKDGSLHNRWAAENGTARPGYERRWQAAEDAIAQMRTSVARTGGE